MPLIFQFDSDPTTFDSTPVEVEIKVKSYATKLWEDDAKLYKQRECPCSMRSNSSRVPAPASMKKPINHIKKSLRNFSSSLG